MKLRFYPFIFLLIFFTFFPINFSSAESLSSKLKGKILLQVENNGEGWYVNPDDSKRCYLGKPGDAFRIMRELGLGISEASYNSFKGVAPKSLSGKILLRVESNGEAYYVFPDDLKIYYLGKPKDAFKIMREKGLGISNNDLNKIQINEKYKNNLSPYPLDLITNPDWKLYIKVPTISNDIDDYTYLVAARKNEEMGVKAFDVNTISGEVLDSVSEYSAIFGYRTKDIVNNKPIVYLELTNSWYEYPAIRVGYNTRTYYIPVQISSNIINGYLEVHYQYDDSKSYDHSINVEILKAEKALFDINCNVKGITISDGKYYYTKNSKNFNLGGSFKCFNNEEDAKKDGYTKALDN